MFAKRLLSAVLLLSLAGGYAAGQGGRADARELVRRGNERYARAEYEAAIREYGRVPAESGEAYAQSLYNLGVCYYELWRTEEAIVMYRRAVAAAAGGRYPKASYALGVALEDLNRLPEAKEAYRQAISASRGRHAPALFRTGLIAAREHDYETAATLFRRANARSENHFPNSHNNLGVMLALEGRLAEAVMEFELALRQAGGDFDEAAHNLSLCRTMLAGGAKTRLASLRIVEATATPVE